MGTLDEIRGLTKVYADARDVLSGRVSALHEELERAKRSKLPGIKSAVARCKEAEAELRAAIESAPGLFLRPRTVTIHGVKVGYQKGKGKLEWDDDADLVAKIERKYADDDATRDLLLVVKVKPSKRGLDTLDVKELRALGVTVEETGDVVLIKPVDSDVDKLVTALLKEKRDEEELSS